MATARSAFAASPVTIMPMGDSITAGADFYTASSGGYRDPLYRDLNAAGISFTFIGANTISSTSALIAAGQTAHNGYGSWRIKDMDNNLSGSAAAQYGGDANQGGYFLTGGHGTGRAAMAPTYLLLEIGTNDLLQGNPNINADLYTLVTDIHALTPNTVILIAGVTPIRTASPAPVLAYNSYIQNQLVPSLSYTRYVDQRTAFMNADGTVDGDLLGIDNIHPNRYGYPVLAQHWAAALEAEMGVAPGGNTLTVQGGSGGGIYPAGSVVTVAANAPASGTQFGAWMPATTAISNVYSPLINYTMPSAQATLTANYAASGSPLVPNGTYEILSPFDGLAIAAAASQNNAQAQQQTYTASPIQQWTLTNLGSNTVSLLLAGTNLALEVPAASAGTLGASLDVAPYVGSSNQQWQISPIDGSMQLLNGSSGQAVNIAGYSTSPGSPLLQYATGYVDELWNFYPVSAPSPLSTLTVNSGSGGGQYTAATTVAIVANTPANGYKFAGWTGDIGSIANPSLASTTIVKTAAAQTITATYAAIPMCALKVVNGTGSGTYPAGMTVTVSANSATGAKFSAWTGDTATLANATGATTTITLPTSGAAISASYTTVTTPVTGGTSLGTFSLLAESASAGNSMVIGYGVSSDGDLLNTYWQGTPQMKVVAMGSSQYELVETIGGRCITVNGSKVAIYSCSGATNQLFGLTVQSDGSYLIQSTQGTCLNSSAAFTTINAPACDASQGELWKFTGPTPLTLGTSSTPTPAPTPTPTPTPTPAPTPVTPVANGTSLGTFSLLAESASAGNSMVIGYGVSSDGDSLNTYWQGTAQIQVLSMGSSQYELVETTGGRCITANGSLVAIYSCTGASNQLFGLVAQSDGSYLIQSSQGTCLNSTAAFTTINAPACNAAAGELWKFAGVTALSLGTTTTPIPTPTPTPVTPVAGGTSLGTFSLLAESASAGNSMVIGYGVSSDGDLLNTYWQGTPQMKVVAMGSSQYELVETIGGRCITVNGSKVAIYSCSGATNQLFGLTVQSDGSYLIQSTQGTCLNSSAAFTTINAPACDASQGELWKFTGPTPLTLAAATGSN